MGCNNRKPLLRAISLFRNENVVGSETVPKCTIDGGFHVLVATPATTSLSVPHIGHFGK